jgi:hypothetical protein
MNEMMVSGCCQHIALQIFDQCVPQACPNNEARLSYLLKKLRADWPRCEDLQLTQLLQAVEFAKNINTIVAQRETETYWVPPYLLSRSQAAAGIQVHDVLYGFRSKLKSKPDDVIKREKEIFRRQQFNAHYGEPHGKAVESKKVPAKRGRPSKQVPPTASAPAPRQPAVASGGGDSAFVPGVAIDCLATDGTLVRRFKNIDEVRSIGFDLVGTLKCLKQEIPTSQGLAWKYYAGEPSVQQTQSSSPRGRPAKRSRKSGNGSDKDYGSDFEEFDGYGIDGEEEDPDDGDDSGVTRRTKSASRTKEEAISETSAIQLYLSDPVVLVLLRGVALAPDRAQGINFVELSNSIGVILGGVVTKALVNWQTRKCVQFKLLKEFIGVDPYAARPQGRKPHHILYYKLGEDIDKFSFGLQIVGPENQVYREFDDSDIYRHHGVSSLDKVSEFFGMKPWQMFPYIFDFGTTPLKETKRLVPPSWAGGLTVKLFIRSKPLALSQQPRQEPQFAHDLFIQQAPSPSEKCSSISIDKVSTFPFGTSLLRAVEDVYAISDDAELKEALEEGKAIRDAKTIYWTSPEPVVGSSPEQSGRDGIMSRRRRQSNSTLAQYYTSSNFESQASDHPRSHTIIGGTSLGPSFDIRTIDSKPIEEIIPVGDDHQASISSDSGEAAEIESSRAPLYLISSLLPEHRFDSEDYKRYWRAARTACFMPGKIFRIPPTCCHSIIVPISAITDKERCHISKDKRLFACVVSLMRAGVHYDIASLVDSETSSDVDLSEDDFKNLAVIVFDGEQLISLPLTGISCDEDDLIREHWVSSRGNVRESLKAILESTISRVRKQFWEAAEIRSFLRLNHRMLFDQRNMFSVLFSLSPLSRTRSQTEVCKFHFDFLAQLENQYGILALCNVIILARSSHQETQRQHEFTDWFLSATSRSGVSVVTEAPGVAVDTSSLLPDRLLSGFELEDSWDHFFGVKYEANQNLETAMTHVETARETNVSLRFFVWLGLRTALNLHVP